MVINFSIGDVLVVKQTYVEHTLSKVTNIIPEGTRTSNIKRTTSLLGQFKHDPVSVINKGTVADTTDEGNAVTRSFIQVRPVDQSHPSYQSGSGIIIYWEDDTTINDIFELSSAFVKDSQAIRCLNSSGVTIFKGAVVYTTGFDTASNLPTVALASAASGTTLAAFGLAEHQILNGAFGTIIIDGHFSGLNTSSFTINDIVFLSDTPGQISVTQGTTPSIVGRAIGIGTTDGTIAFRGIIPLGQGVGGGAPGAQGTTGVTGDTGIQGLVGSAGAAGVTGVVGNTGSQGNTGVGFIGIQGITGIGILGATGIRGDTGVQGVTGMLGLTGLRGVTGFLGITGFQGIQGDTGVLGLTGIAAEPQARDTFTGSLSNGQTSFTLSSTPTSNSLVQMEVNGALYRNTAFFTISGTTLTWTDVFTIDDSDTIDIVYFI